MKIYYLFPFLILACSHQPAQKESVQSLPVIDISAADVSTYQVYPAAVEGSDDIEIRPQVSGFLDQIFVDDGAFVNAGQTLFRIEQAPFSERLNSSTASLHSAQGALTSAQNEIDKLTPLVTEKVIADYQLKTATSAREVALGNVEQAKAAIASAKINMGYTLIKAPFTGYIGRVLRKRGSLIGPADPLPLTELSAVKIVHVFFSLGEFDFIQFKEQYAGKTIEDKIKKLPPVELLLANDSVYPSKGRIDLIDGQFDKNTGAITVRASFPNPDGLLRSGNTGKVKLGLLFANQAIVPQSATQEMQDKVFVFLLNDSNKVSKQLITISGKSGTNYLVKDGLKAGDRIVYSGYDHLHEGDIIQPKKP
jgi:membrane fusion protein (multidrug efflux system)